MSGIYVMKIGTKLYVGKDVQINNQKRLKEHVRLLEKNEHYNNYLQRAYNKYQLIEYEVLEDLGDVDLKTLADREEFWIHELKSYEEGYNLTTGREGLGGYQFTHEQLEAKSHRIAGEKNPMAKLKDSDAKEVIAMLLSGASNKEVADKYGLHDRYVSLIRHKKRFKHVWEKFPDVESPKSNPKGVHYMTPEDEAKVRELISQGMNNMQIYRVTGIQRARVAKIRKQVKTFND